MFALGGGCGPAPVANVTTPVPIASSTAISEKPVQPGPRMTLSELSKVLGVKTTADQNEARTVDGYRAWTRARLAEPEIYDSLAPRITSLMIGGSSVTGAFLGPAKSDRGRDYYFHTAKKCTDKDLVPVRPWWAPQKEILICPHDYRPERTIGKLGKTACDVTFGGAIHPVQECGCGPNLIFCAPFDLSLDQAMSDEVRDTIRHIVETDRPFGEILTTNQTMRNGKADFWYNRVEFFRTGKFEFPDLTKPSRLVIRPEYFGGGVLSTFPALFSDGPRTNTASVLSDYLCVPLRSSAVLTDRLVEVAHSLADKVGDIRAEPVLDLAQTEGCQNCHAKLEYGVVARDLWKPNLNGTHLSSAPRKYKTTRLYVKNHTDLRGEGPANLAWYGEAIAKQPEFSSCMTNKIASWLYEGQNPPAGVIETLHARFEQGQNMKRLIEDAVIARTFGPSAIDSASNKIGTNPPRKAN